MPTSHITIKQQEIISLLYRFRFLHRVHIQTLLHHKDPKTINLWLHDLTDKQYTGRIYTTKFHENTKPAIYYLKTNGLKYLRTQTDIENRTLRKLTRESQRSQAFIEQCLILGSIYLDLSQQSTDQTRYNMFVASEYASLPMHDVLTDLSPSAYVVRNKEGKVDQFLLELLSDVPASKVRQRIKQYFLFYESNEWEASTNQPFPTILFVCPNKQSLISIKRYLRKSLAFIETPPHIRLTTQTEVKEGSLVGQIWEDVR